MDVRTPAISRMEHFVTIVNAFPKKKKKKTVKKSVKKENEHCGRKIPTNKYSKGNTHFFFQSRTSCVNDTLLFFYL